MPQCTVAHLASCIIRSVIFVSTAALLGCPNETKSTTDAGVSDDVAALRRDFANFLDAYCALDVRCPQNDRPFISRIHVTAAACVYDNEAANGYSCRDDSYYLDDRKKFAASKTCADALNKLTCNGFGARPATPPECKLLLPDVVAPRHLKRGEICGVNTVTCDDGLVCAADGGAKSVCGDPKVGDACSDYCTGSWCDLTTKKCEAYLDQGTSCKDAAGSGYCLGASLLIENQCDACGPTAYCNFSGSDGVPSTCEARAEIGESCTTLLCAGGARCDATTEKCVAQKALGDPCSESGTDTSCLSGVCNGKICVKNGGNLGDPCWHAYDGSHDDYTTCFAPLVCVDDVCQLPNPHGGNCQFNEQCEGGLTCTDSKCGPVSLKFECPDVD